MFLFLHPAVHRFYQRGASFGGDFLFLDFLTDGRLGRFWAATTPFGVLLATLVGVPMYADIFGTIPVAEALLAKGAQLGTILAFMMAVTTLSLPSIIMLRKAVKPKLLALFVGVCTAGIILVGYLFNVFQFIII